MELLRANSYELGNADITVCAEAPRLNPHIPSMQACLSETMQVAPDTISIKATTSEKMGFVGREEGIAVYAVVLIIQI
jgi:2-C-methyl-D-erythritol 2,4-cyclodiphosphate synthase